MTTVRLPPELWPDEVAVALNALWAKVETHTDWDEVQVTLVRSSGQITIDAFVQDI